MSLNTPGTVRILLPKPLEWQLRVKEERARYNVIIVGRRAGKTTLLEDLCAEPDVLAYPIGWFSPTYKDMLEVWDELATRFAPITRRISTQDRRIENIAGGVLEFWSMENIHAGRGRKYKRVLIDEAAKVPTLLRAWNQAIRPTLADYRGDAWIASTPLGRNGLWQLYQWGIDDGRKAWRAWQMPSSVNPFIAAEEIAEMRDNMPDLSYRQEILAEFVDDGVAVIRFVDEAVTDDLPHGPDSRSTYVAGIDWALTNDYTVCIVVDATTGLCVAVDRFNGVDYAVQRERIAALCRHWRVTSAVGEQNSMGKPNNDELRRMSVPVRDFTTTNASKADIIEELAAAFEHRRIKIPRHAALIDELKALQSERLPGGGVRYAAPDGLHDDCAIALALAWYGASNRPQRPRVREY